MDWVEVRIACTEIQQEIYIAYLNEAGYDSFVQEEKELIAYIAASLFNEKELKEICGENVLNFQVLEQQNWNQTWQEGFKALTIPPSCLVISSFHKSEYAQEILEGKYQYVIEIDPTMAFGTGHHATTQMMINILLNTGVTSQLVLDMGCGTGILGILASKMGAKGVFLIDNDPQATTVCTENVQINHVLNAQVFTGDASVLTTLCNNNNQKFDYILANITRNTLIEYAPELTKALKQHGKLALSGFMETDVEDIENVYNSWGCKMLERQEKEEWRACLFEKITT